MNVSLTPKLEEFVRRKVASGLYNNASEVIREALRLMVEHSGDTGARPNQPPKKDKVRNTITALKVPLRERGITSLAIFGSLLDDTAGPQSDIDLLIDIDPRVRFSLVDLVSAKQFLEDRLGHRVDLVLKEGLEPAIRDSVLREADVVF
jgi:predicted nucleotidyltransferase